MGMKKSKKKRRKRTLKIVSKIFEKKKHVHKNIIIISSYFLAEWNPAHKVELNCLIKSLSSTESR